jgi:hypothetical protein
LATKDTQGEEMNKKQVVVTWVVGIYSAVILLYVLLSYNWAKLPAAEGMDLQFLKEVNMGLLLRIGSLPIFSVIFMLIIGGLLIYSLGNKKL